MQDLTSVADVSKQIDMVIMDFEKAFDKVPHSRLLAKIYHYGIRGQLHKVISQTGSKKCFIPQSCEKYTNFDSAEHSL